MQTCPQGAESCSLRWSFKDRLRVARAESKRYVGFRASAKGSRGSQNLLSRAPGLSSCATLRQTLRGPVPYQSLLFWGTHGFAEGDLEASLGRQVGFLVRDLTGHYGRLSHGEPAA